MAWRHSGLGAAYYQAADPQRTARRLTKRPERLGYRVTLVPAPVARLGCGANVSE